MTQIEIEEKKHIQLDIVLAFHEYCESNKINYSLADGTLIGAVRHHGYIPWDDDIDVCLLRNEYDKLIQSFPSLYKGKFSLISFERDKRWGRPYAKLYNIHTLEVEESYNNKPEIGVGIDVFPLDDVPDNELYWKRYNRIRRFVNNLSRIKSIKWNKSRSLRKNITASFFRAILSPLSFRCLARITDRNSKRYNGKGYHHIFENCLGMIMKHSFLKESFAETVLAMFEGHQLRIMKGYDDCLSNSYGDYMKLPPIEKRVAHHSSMCFWID